MVRSEGIDTFPVVHGVAKIFPFSNSEEAGPAKTVMVIRRTGIMLRRHAVLTSHQDTDDFGCKYLTGEPTEE